MAISYGGGKTPTGGFEIQEATIGRPTAYGDTAKLSEIGRISLQNIDAENRNQCVLLHLVLGRNDCEKGEKMESLASITSWPIRMNG